MEIEINKVYSMFCEGNISYEKLKKETALFAYEKIKGFPQFNEDDAHNLFLSFYDKLDGFINRFQKEKSSYQSFLTMTLKYLGLNYKRKEFKHLVREIAVTKYHIEESQKENNIVCAPCNHQIYTANSKNEVEDRITYEDDLKILRNKIEKICATSEKYERLQKHALLTLLKESPHLTASQIHCACKSYKLDERMLNHFITEIAIICEKKIQRFNYYQELLNDYFTESKILHERSKLTEDPFQRDTLIEQENKLKLQISKINLKLQKIKTRPSNRTLSKITAIPKGTIDLVFITSAKWKV